MFLRIGKHGIVIASKILYLFILCFSYDQSEFLIFFQILVTRSQAMTYHSFQVFSSKIDFWPEEQFWYKLYSKANLSTQVMFLNFYISWKYITKMKNIYVHTEFFFSQNRPNFDHNFLQKPTIARRPFWFFWLCIT